MAEELPQKRQNQMIKFFSETTGLDNTSSRRWLESNRWKIDVALKRFEAERFGANDATAFLKSTTDKSEQQKTPELSQQQKNEFVDKFCQQTGVSRDTAKTCLESLDWKLEAALANHRRKHAAQSSVLGLLHSDKKTAAPPPKPPFSGKGNILGGEQELQRLQAKQRQNELNVELSQDLMTKDETEAEDFDNSQPSTTLQIRLPNNDRLKVKFNQSHTVGDVRSHIQRWRPTVKPGFRLMTSYPVEELLNDRAILSDAQLLNAALQVVR